MNEAAFIAKPNGAEGEAAASQTQLEIACRRSYLSSEVFKNIDARYETLPASLTASRHPTRQTPAERHVPPTSRKLFSFWFGLKKTLSLPWQSFMTFSTS